MHSITKLMHMFPFDRPMINSYRRTGPLVVEGPSILHLWYVKFRSVGKRGWKNELFSQLQSLFTWNLFPEGLFCGTRNEFLWQLRKSVPLRDLAPVEKIPYRCYEQRWSLDGEDHSHHFTECEKLKKAGKNTPICINSLFIYLFYIKTIWIHIIYQHTIIHTFGHSEKSL